MQQALPQNYLNADSLIFDLDGTLWDNTVNVAKIFSVSLKKMKPTAPDISATDIAKIMGMPADEVYKKIFPGMDSETIDEFKKSIRPLLSLPPQDSDVVLYTGVREGLRFLHTHYRLFIVSNCGKGYIENFLTWSGLTPLIEDFECYGNTNLTKAENIADVVRRNSLNSPIYIGDTDGDQEASHQAGIPYIHVTYGFGNPSRPCPKIGSFLELTQILLKQAQPAKI